MLSKAVILVSLLLTPSLAQNATRSSSAFGTGTAVANLTSATSSPGVISPQYALNGFEGCEADQGMDPDWIKDGFSDAITMIQGSTFGYFPSFDWNGGAAQDFWGPYSRNKDLRSLIKGNLNRLASISYQYWLNPFAPRLHVRCDDPNLKCPCIPGQSRQTVAYTINGEPHINFCPIYFQQLSLDQAMGQSDPPQESNVLFWRNRARTWVHELTHVREIGHPTPSSSYSNIKDLLVQGWPGIPFGRKSYGDWYTKWLAQSPGNLPDDPVNNADNYAMFVLANYVQSQKGWYPSGRPLPVSPLTVNGYVVAGVNGTGVEADGIGGGSPYDDYC